MTLSADQTQERKESVKVQPFQLQQIDVLRPLEKARSSKNNYQKCPTKRLLTMLSTESEK